MKSPSRIAGALSLAVLVAGHPVVSAQSTESPCAFVSIGIVTGAASVFPGTAVGIGGTVRNCSDRKGRYTLVISGMSSCGQKVEISSSRMALGPGENRSWSVSYTIPANACSGIWEASVQAHEGRENGGTDSTQAGSALASSSATVIVE